MSDLVLTGLDGFDTVIPAKKAKVKKDSKTKALFILIAIMCILLAAEGLAYFLIVPAMGNARIKFSGLNNYSESEIAKIAAPYCGKSVFAFNTFGLSDVLCTVPGIESVKIVKRFPDTIYVNVTERTPVAMTFIDIGDRTVPVQIDKNGVLFPSGGASFARDGSVPILSGIPIENIPEGMRIPSKYHGLIQQIADIKAVNNAYFGEVSEIHVVPKEYGNYELVLYPVKGHTKVLADRELNEEALQYMMVTLDVVKRMDPNVEVVDLRYGSVSYYSDSRRGASFE